MDYTFVFYPFAAIVYKNYQFQLFILEFGVNKNKEFTYRDPSVGKYHDICCRTVIIQK